MLRQLRVVACSLLGGHRYKSWESGESPETDARWLMTCERCWVCGVKKIGWSKKKGVDISRSEQIYSECFPR